MVNEYIACLDRKIRTSIGFSLVELMVAMTIGLIVVGVIGATFVMQHKSYNDQSQIIALQENLRAGLDIMTREIMLAGYDPTGAAGAGILIADSNRLQITMDLTGDGDVDDSNEDILFEIDGSALQLKRNNQPLAEFITGLTFTYYDVNDALLSGVPLNAADRARVARITVSLTGRTPKADPVLGYRQRTFTEDIRLRNLPVTTTTTIATTTSTTTTTTTTAGSTSTTVTESSTTTSSTTTSTTTSSTTTSTTTSSTTTSTVPGPACVLQITLTSCKPNGANKAVYARATVTNGGAPASGCTVNWSINDDTQGSMVDLGGGYYGGGYSGCNLKKAAKSQSKYDINWSGTVSATASKDGCVSASTSITVAD
jgi:type IV pilus assembly protein PilW